MTSLAADRLRRVRARTRGCRRPSRSDIDAALAASWDVDEIAYFAASHAIEEDSEPWAATYAAEDALRERGLDPDEFEVEVFDAAAQARADFHASLLIAAEGGGSEDYAAARSFYQAANLPWRTPVVLVVRPRGRCARPATNARRHGSRRCTSRAGPDDPDEADLQLTAGAAR